MAIRRRQRRRAATTSEKLLTADFPRWKSVIQRSASTLSADSLRRVRQLRARDREARAIERLAVAPMADVIRDQPSGARARRESLDRLRRDRSARVRDPRALPGVEPRVIDGSILNVFAAPYDAAWTQSLPKAGSSQPTADAIQGTFGVFASGNGDSVFGGAGIGMGFHAVSNLPMAHVRPYFRYSYFWKDYSFLATAHTRALLKIRAIQFGPGGRQTKFPPDDVAHQLWSDGTGWFESHQDEGDDVWPGTIQLDFPLVANQFYAIWIYCQVFADDDAKGDFEYSDAAASLKVRVPFFVVEESQT